MNKIIISCDSTADLNELAKIRNIPIISLGVYLGEREGLDGEEVSPDDIYAYFDETQKVPKTFAVSPQRYYDFFEKLTLNGDTVIHFTISKSMSSCYDNAVASATEFGRVHVIDSETLTVGIALLALYARDLADDGMPVESVLAAIESKKREIRLQAIVDKMTFLSKSGRCPSIISIIASVLKIRPALVGINGTLTLGKKYIGPQMHAVKKFVADTLAKYPKLESKYIFVAHTSAPEAIVREVKARLAERFPEANIYEIIPGATITAHLGKGALGLIFFSE